MTRASVQRLPALAHDICRSLAVHRLATTRQVHALLAPGSTLRWVQLVLGRAQRAGLLDRVGVTGSKEWAWFLSPVGYASTTDVEPRPYRMTTARALGPLQQHTLETVETGLSFVRHVPGLSWLSWRPECKVRESVIADAIVDLDGHRVHIEVDRGTETTARLVAKIDAYSLPWEPPTVCLVLSGPDAMGRLAAVTEQCRRSPASGSVDLLVTTLALLREHGPLARVWVTPDGDDAVGLSRAVRLAG